jgi:hypothetical protein
MMDCNISFALPEPWVALTFERSRIGAVNFLVGPNGSGKSRFANSLRDNLPNARLLGTDRLQGMSANQGFGVFGDNFAGGFQKSYFSHFKSNAHQGSAIDTFILLEERPDVRVKVEATLSSLFNRNITIEWDSGNLIPKATLGPLGTPYRLDRDECHGIKELLVLLTHLYNNEHDYLIIDEPELNLHPQYQAFFMQEVRKIAGTPGPFSDKKIVFLITHSPFMIDIRSNDDLYSLTSFSSDFTLPVAITSASDRIISLVPRLNVHHKQLFFSDNPIFVEGILDSQMIEAVQQRRNFSITAAGSCVIDVGGCEEVNKYVEFCRGLKKSAYFLYDLDSLFLGTLRQCIRSDTEVSSFLAGLGLGTDFARYCGELDRKLGEAIAAVRASTSAASEIVELKAYLDRLADDAGELRDKALQRARVAMAMDIRQRRTAIAAVVSEPTCGDVEGRLSRIVELLKAKNVFLLSGGALEHYLPAYRGDRYKLEEGAKRNAVETEVLELARGVYDAVLKDRYLDLFDVIAELPAKPPVDTDAVLKSYLAGYIHDLQGRALVNPDWSTAEINTYFERQSSGIGKLFRVSEFERRSPREFSAKIAITGDGRVARISHQTNAGMREFELDAALDVGSSADPA